MYFPAALGFLGSTAGLDALNRYCESLYGEGKSDSSVTSFRFNRWEQTEWPFGDPERRVSWLPGRKGRPHRSFFPYAVDPDENCNIFHVKEDVRLKHSCDDLLRLQKINDKRAFRFQGLRER